MMEINKILFPCDLTEGSSKILPYVLALSQKYNSLIYLLYVEDVRVWGGHFIPHPSLSVFEKEALGAAKKAMDRVCEQELEGCPNFQRRIASGDPASEILKTIESEGIDMVIMGTHGRKGLDHTIFGSVTEKVVKKSPVPVLVINPHKAQPVHTFEWGHRKQSWNKGRPAHAVS